ALRTGARAWHRVEDVRDLGAAEVGVERQPGPRPEQRPVAGLAQTLPCRCRDAGLPHDRVGDRGASPAIPDDRRLALVRDPDRGDALRPANIADDLLRDLELAGPDGLRVMGDVARRWVVLLERLLGRRHRPPVAAERDRPRRGRALVEGEDQSVVAHGSPYSRRAV